MPSLLIVISPPTVVPGQPFGVRWMICPDIQSVGEPPTASINLSLDGTHIRIFEAEAGSAVVPAVSGIVPMDRFRVPAGFYRSGTSHTVQVVARLANGGTLSATS